jgi:hypothetical protein
MKCTAHPAHVAYLSNIETLSLNWYVRSAAPWSQFYNNLHPATASIAMKKLLYVLAPSLENNVACASAAYPK